MENTGIFSSYFAIRLLINMVAMIVLIRIIYFSTYQKRDSFFTFFLLNFIVFLLAYMLEKTSGFTSMGSAFGLLAAFSLLRFRTDTISMKDMTYLFIIMALGLLNSAMKGSHLEIVALNVMIIGAVFIVDGNRLMRNQKSKSIEYPSIENIHPEKHPILIEDLRQRTGLDIRKISIEEIDFNKSRVIVRIYYY